MDPTSKVEARARKVGQVGLGEDAELEDRNLGHLHLAFHLHLGPCGSTSDDRGSHLGEISDQPFVGAGADVSNLNDRIPAAVHRNIE